MSTEKTKKQSYKFKAEVSQLLNILTHSLYSHRDVFIRELISNAVDALDKIRFKEIKSEEISHSDLDLEINITLDKDARTFTITDTGIGMSKEELIENIGTIARSGTADFLKAMVAGGEDSVNLIGRFGVGFYSVFMAAEKVELTTRGSGVDAPVYTWISDGEGRFTINEGADDNVRGTKIVAYLREDAEDFADEFRVKNAIKKYSNFVPFPINVNNERVNTISAIWREPKSSVTDEQYNEFFKFIAHLPDDPVARLHFSADVPLQFHSLLYVPKTNMEIMGFGREDDGIQLFVRRVMIDSNSKDILPQYLRFVRGVLESDDLPLNISRETLQENPHLMKIKNIIVSKLLSQLAELANTQPDAYKELWQQHGRIIKEGYNDYANKDKVAELFRFDSSKPDADGLVGLSEYVERMHEKQEGIFFLSGASREALINHPTMELFKSKGIEVLFCYDPIDEFVLPGLFEFKGKKILSADQADISKLDEIKSEKSENDENKPEIDKKAASDLAHRMKNILGDKVEDVKISERLVDSPAVLVSKDSAMSSQMEKIMHMVNKDTKIASKVLEINPAHTLILDMEKLYQNDAVDPRLDILVESLYASVMLLDGTIEDPHAMAAAIQSALSQSAAMMSDKSE
ncbi:molecular chaperone HtpG [bacterium]|nr:molecular chaperone HtpG [bacterium]